MSTPSGVNDLLSRRRPVAESGDVLTTLADATTATAGGKAGALGVLLRAGLPVPPGVVLPLRAYRAVVAGHAPADVARREGPHAARRLVGSLPLPVGLVAELAAALPALGGGPVAVRSSSTGEDTAADSGAGQLDTFLAVAGADAVADRVRDCWASLWSDRGVV
jgi:pyruvate, water dikinase